MKKLLFLLTAFALVLSCSSDETSTPVTPPPAPIVKYTITLSAGEGGTVSTTGGEYEAGQTVSVTATPQGEYLFKDWSDGNTDATRTITISSNSALTANFEKRKYPLTLNIEGEGEILEEIVNAGRTTDYDSGTTVKLTAVPAEGWEFVGWTGAIESAELEVQLLVSVAKEISAVFQFDCKSITSEIPNWNDLSYNLFDIELPKNPNGQVNTDMFELMGNFNYGCGSAYVDYNNDGFKDVIAFENNFTNNIDREDGYTGFERKQQIRFYLGSCDGFKIDSTNDNKFTGLVHGRKLLIGDYNKDNYVDFFLIGHGYDRLPFPGEFNKILMSDGNQGFEEIDLDERISFFHGGASGDFDNDNDLDVFVIDAGRGYSGFYINDGTGNFTFNSDIIKMNLTNGMFNAEMFDINNDGFLDLIYGGHDISDGTREYDNTSIVHYGNGQGFNNNNFIRLPKSQINGQGVVTDFKFYDLDSDGLLEIILIKTGDDFDSNENFYKGWSIQVLKLINGDYIDMTSQFTDYSYNSNGNWIRWVDFSDIDNDGLIEMFNAATKNSDEYVEWEVKDNMLIRSN